MLTKEGEEEYKRKTGKLGTSGLALHYANIINQIESVVRTWKISWNTFFFPLLMILAPPHTR